LFSRFGNFELIGFYQKFNAVQCCILAYLNLQQLSNIFLKEQLLGIHLNRMLETKFFLPRQEETFSSDHCYFSPGTNTFFPLLLIASDAVYQLSGLIVHHVATKYVVLLFNK
jgi:hypothetical protein